MRLHLSPGWPTSGRNRANFGRTRPNFSRHRPPTLSSPPQHHRPPPIANPTDRGVSEDSNPKRGAEGDAQEEHRESERLPCPADRLESGNAADSPATELQRHLVGHKARRRRQDPRIGGLAPIAAGARMTEANAAAPGCSGGLANAGDAARQQFEDAELGCLAAQQGRPWTAVGHVSDLGDDVSCLLRGWQGFEFEGHAPIRRISRGLQTSTSPGQTRLGARNNDVSPHSGPCSPRDSENDSNARARVNN